MAQGIKKTNSPEKRKYWIKRLDTLIWYIIALKSWVLWIWNYTSMVHFTGYIFSLASGVSSFTLVIYDLYCQSKLLIKIQLYVMQLGIDFFLSFPVQSHIHIECILVVIMKYEVIGPSLIVIICHSNFFLMVQWSDWKYLSAGAITFLRVCWATRGPNAFILLEM